MISDPNALKELQQEWEGVRALRHRIERGMSIAMFPDGYPYILSKMAHNLPLLHACGVLNKVLLHLRDERHFQCENKNNKTLGYLIDASKKYLKWNNFGLIQKIKNKRNSLAHNGLLVPANDCLTYVRAIEEQLIAWKVINPV